MKATRLSSGHFNRVRGWTGQKYVRRLSARFRRRAEKDMLRTGDYENEPAKIPAKGWAD